MLKEIRCDKFNQKKVTFHNGLNIVLGDDKASNSIGKTTMLMIIDFIFGGNTYIKDGANRIENLGHHTFEFEFEFSNQHFYFTRSTNNHLFVDICNEKYNKLKEISLDEYKKFISNKYDIEFLGSNVRTIIGTYSRIWGKNNYDVEKPLKTNDSKNETAINNIIKLFNKYSLIESLELQINKIKGQKEAISKAIVNNLIPSITKVQYNKNLIEIENISKKIEKYKKSMNDLNLDLNSLMSEEILELKNQKNSLFVKKNQILNKIKRIDLNLNSEDIKVNSKLNKLLEFFPNINMKKLNDINEFHKKMSSSLKSELNKEKEELESILYFIEEDIKNITNEIQKKLKTKSVSEYNVDRLADLLAKEYNLKQINKYYEKQQNTKADLKEIKENLNDIKNKILSEISNSINIEMNELFKRIYKEKRNSPVFNINLDTYSLKRYNDTGTGSSYINLISFDLAIFELTKLPILIHDSILFKNIEVPAFENLINIYASFEKQIFISIDEIKRFSDETISKIENNSIIKLSDKKILFIKNWKITNEE